MAISKDRLAAIISGKAAKLCSSESQKQIKALGTSMSNRLDEATMQGDDMAAQYEAMLGYNSDENSDSRDISFTSDDVQLSNLPEHIKNQCLNITLTVVVLEEPRFLTVWESNLKKMLR